MQNALKRLKCLEILANNSKFIKNCKKLKSQELSFKELK